MKYLGLLTGLLFLSTPVLADILYQANVGGYSTSQGIGLGSDTTVGSRYTPYAPQHSSYSRYAAVPYDSFTYPYSEQCCGCNNCNNCDTSYSNRCR